MDSDYINKIKRIDDRFDFAKFIVEQFQDSFRLEKKKFYYKDVKSGTYMLDNGRANIRRYLVNVVLENIRLIMRTEELTVSERKNLGKLKTLLGKGEVFQQLRLVMEWKRQDEMEVESETESEKVDEVLCYQNCQGTKRMYLCDGYWGPCMDCCTEEEYQEKWRWDEE